MNPRGTIIVLTLAIALCPAAASPSPQSHYFFATQSGSTAADRWAGGKGSPFGSSLAELLQRDELTLETLARDLAATTERKARHQRPQIPPNLPVWQIRPAPQAEKRVALVLVYSNYTAMRDLDGAANDADTVATALENANFVTTRLLDPQPAELEQKLEHFARQSTAADVALVFATGHGLESQGVAYLLTGTAAQPGLPLTRLGQLARARRLNLIFFGGCREDLPTNNPRPPMPPRTRSSRREKDLLFFGTAVAALVVIVGSAYLAWRKDP